MTTTWITKDRSFYRNIFKLAIPISMQHMVTFLVGFADNVMVGRLGAPIWAVYLCLKCDQILKCIVAVIKVNRFRWIRELAKSE